MQKDLEKDRFEEIVVGLCYYVEFELCWCQVCFIDENEGKYGCQYIECFYGKVDCECCRYDGCVGKQFVIGFQKWVRCGVCVIGYGGFFKCEKNDVNFGYFDVGYDQENFLLVGKFQDEFVDCWSNFGIDCKYDVDYVYDVGGLFVGELVVYDGVGNGCVD